MSFLLQPGGRISQSGNIALYPSLCVARHGVLACCWYEYTSPDRPTRSDIWFSQQVSDGEWSPAINLSGGVSYNNGPALACNGEGQFVAAWHSWRPPGREPFSAEGDRYHIWTVSSGDGKHWTDARLLFEELPQTKYAAVAFSGESCFLAFSQQSTKTILTSSSPDGRLWDSPRPLCEKASRFPSICCRADGSLLMAFSVPGEKGLWLSNSREGKKWETPRHILADYDGGVTKPKVSVDSSGAVWLACQTENWGSFRRRFRVSCSRDVLKILFSTGGGAGNGVWTLNAINISRSGEKKELRFGPAFQQDPSGTIRIGAANWSWQDGRPCGFDGPVEEILRELGDETTRSMVYSDRDRTLGIRIGPGDFDVEIVYSSWVAARPAFQASFDADCSEEKSVSPRGDQCLLFRARDGVNFELIAETSPDEDHSRPSAVCETMPGHYWVAWSSFDGPLVQIVSQTLKKYDYR